ncbi:glycine dehydrogenase (aminomethyl-transferring) [Rickettsiella grylli]|uniref:aminomethyl-transferring glycine dehydrogenase subunit GcvPB n=1 Tax=Rickettsiella grylli TaxID=59196 RepID=UPI0008FD13D0|nr:aminomethyl-transferring glycine dehydrogenase subunit GcvPB [Rickettsiella grylli]OIZ98978.1 glycine dehydrogenase (aminomethyl-transferring) [Rickettsiella grylli]
MLIFEVSQTGRVAKSQIRAFDSKDTTFNTQLTSIPENYLRKTKLCLPEVSELQVVRHFTRLSQKNFSIDTHFYPLGSCTMKYNPRGVHRLASLPAFLHQHPLLPETSCQATLRCLYEFQEILKDITGMSGVSLTPMAGAQGEFAGVAMIKAYHASRHDTARTEFLIPDAAHGTNPASAAMCGYSVREIPTNPAGDIDLDALYSAVGSHTAGIMLTNPSTLGVFEQHIEQIASIIHQAGGLLYYDGANLNAILGKVRPKDMGFDVMHLNLHKTFATPHGGGGPGAGPVAVGERLLPFLPIPIVAFEKNRYRWLHLQDCPQSIGRLSTFMGNTGILLRAYFYACLLGREGLKRVSEFATLNANYLLKQLQRIGYLPAFPQRRASHEFILTLKNLSKQANVTAMDVSKRLLDFGFHAPTTYFPLLIPECLLIEPTETESKQELDQFISAMEKILIEAKKNPTHLNNAPHHLRLKRLDDVKAVRELDLTWEN